MNFLFVKNPKFKFIATFLFFSLFFYYGSYFYIGITAPGVYYFPFLDKYLNIFNWYRAFLLTGSHFVTELFGYQTIIINKFHLQMVNGHSVQIVYTCMGAGLLGVWFAFVIAYPSFLKKKVIWILIGFSVISLLNMIRLAGLLIVANKVNLKFIDHHTYYNIVVYIFIIIMIYFFTREPKKLT